MIEKRVSAVLFLGAMLLVPLMMWFSGGFDHFAAVDLEEVISGSFAGQIEKDLKRNFPGANSLSSLAWNVRYRTGEKEIDGYFITEKSIIKNVEVPDETLVKRNSENIAAFAARTEIPTYFMLIPTACAVKQRELPDFSSSVIYNQKNLIEEVYRNLGGSIYTADVYSTLVANQEKYLYFNTEDRLTPLGGYYIYSVLGDKLDASVRTIDNYTIEYVLDGYFGTLHTKFPYARVQPDLISLYHFRSGSGNFSRSYTLKAVGGVARRTLDGLYDYAKLTGDDPMRVYFGGDAQKTTIEIRKSDNRPTPNQIKLLIIGDQTASAYVPFLTPHYSEIEIVNAATATPEQLAEVDTLYYDQVLFAFSTDTYMHNANLLALEKF